MDSGGAPAPYRERLELLATPGLVEARIEEWAAGDPALLGLAEVLRLLTDPVVRYKPDSRCTVRGGTASRHRAGSRSRW